MIIYLMRHGESTYNVKHLINHDPKVVVSLTDKGRAQVLEAAEKLKGVKFDMVFSSEFLRVQETAGMIAHRNGSKIEYDSRINEINLGMEGEPAEKYDQAIQKSKNPFTYKKKGTESHKDVKKRVLSFLEDIKEKGYRDVLIVAHEGVIKMAIEILAKMKDGENMKNPVKNAEYFVFKY